MTLERSLAELFVVAYRSAYLSDNLNRAELLRRRAIRYFNLTQSADFSYNGPLPCECQHCGQLFQFVDDHTCTGTIGDNVEASRLG